MTILTFAINALDNSALTVTPVLDGVPLTQLVAEFEREHGFHDPAGGYGGLVPDYLNYGLLDRYFMGTPEGDYWSGIGGQYLLGCDCGEVGCWPLVGRIEQKGGLIIWSSFRQPHRPNRDYSEFGPFVFDLKQYTIEVQKAAAKFSDRPGAGPQLSFRC